MIITLRQRVLLSQAQVLSEHFAVYRHLNTLLLCWEWQLEALEEQERHNKVLRSVVIRHRLQRRQARWALFFSRMKRRRVVPRLRKHLQKLFRWVSQSNKERFEHLVHLLAERLVLDYDARCYPTKVLSGKELRVMRQATKETLMLNCKQKQLENDNKKSVEKPKTKAKAKVRKGALMRSIIFQETPKYFGAVGRGMPIRPFNNNVIDGF